MKIVYFILKANHLKSDAGVKTLIFFFHYPKTFYVSFSFQRHVALFSDHNALMQAFVCVDWRNVNTSSKTFKMSFSQNALFELVGILEKLVIKLFTTSEAT